LKKIIAIIGARPQFIKHAALDIASRGKIKLVTIHTGQHYDENMSGVFFNQLKITKPDYLLKTGGLLHGHQTGLMMQEIEQILVQESPDGVLVYGDTNSTLAGALVASKLHIPVFHVEAGLRSYNKKMPEEINRVLTDHVSDLLFVTSSNATENLHKEGIRSNIIEVGDVMYDMILIAQNELGSTPKIEDYYFCTLHRPYNVDEKSRFLSILKTLDQLDKRIVFPIHPRSQARLKSAGINQDQFPNIYFIEPVSYFDNIAYLASSSGLITDSGGMQKEAYWLKKKCITLRSETEWTETLEHNWNRLVFDDLSQIQLALKEKPGKYVQLYGDGKAAEKIVDILYTYNNKQ
jgi:UDP-GlcNAc3NAcA epimerase